MKISGVEINKLTLINAESLEYFKKRRVT